MITPHHFEYAFLRGAPYNLVMVRTPLRISFFGGGTDYPEYYLREGGRVLATSINKYAYFTLNRLGELVPEKYRLHYSRYEAANRIQDIQHPGVRGCLEYLKIDGGLNLSYTADLPARTGLGASSCFIVGLLHALHAFHRCMISHEELAQLAIYVEQEILKERVGSQDQYMCAMGNLRKVVFERNGSIHSDLLCLPMDRREHLEERLMLFFTNLTRYADEILEEQVKRTKEKANDVLLRDMCGLVDHACAILEGKGEPDDLGAALHEGWKVKRELSSKVATAAIDEMYEAARKAGALGGKLLGAGGGGFLLLYVPPGASQPSGKPSRAITRCDSPLTSPGRLSCTSTKTSPLRDLSVSRISLQVCILAGGLGTRLRPVLQDRPKVLVPVGDRTFLEVLVRYLCGQGLCRFVFLLGYMHEAVEDCLRRTIRPRCPQGEFAVSVEPQPMGTGGAVKFAQPLLEDDFFLLNGDSYLEFDPRAMFQVHQDTGAEATLAVREVPEASRYGSVDVAPDGRIVDFREKDAARGPGLINAGTYILKRSVVESIPPGLAVSIERETFPHLLSSSRLVMSCRQDQGRFIDIGTPGSYRQFLEMDF